MSGIKELVKKEAVTIIAAIAAIISCFFVPVTNYVKYIDTDMIGVLFGLMAVVAGFEENNVFRWLTEKVLSSSKNTRILALLLTLTVFFLSMFITNDVALIAFVPFTIMLYEKAGYSPVYVIVLETIAANMGSALTPFGNPQNLYLFSVSKMTSVQFFSITVPVTAISLVLLIIASLFVKKHELNIERNTEVRIINRRYLYLYTALFILCILSVFKIVDLISVFASVCVVVAIIQPKVFSKVDYGLLLTFVCFFIFVGNIKNIPEVTELASEMIMGHEFEATLAASQIISNVPSAVMMSAFTHNYKALILGSDIGGLGTLIASLASLISYKSYLRSENHDTSKFIFVFTFMNVIFLAVLYTAAKLLIL